jgi:hypothetical protein
MRCDKGISKELAAQLFFKFFDVKLRYKRFHLKKPAQNEWTGCSILQNRYWSLGALLMTNDLNDQ